MSFFPGAGYDDQDYMAMAPSTEDVQAVDEILLAFYGCIAIVILLYILLRMYVWRVLHQPVGSRSAIGAAVLWLLQEAELTDVGLEQFTIDALPLFVFCVRESWRRHNFEPTLVCTVCLSMFNAGERIRVLPDCKHSFHAECIDEWLALNPTCPVCRTRVVSILQKESRDPPVRRLGPFEVVMTTTVSSLWPEGMSDLTPSSEITQSVSHERRANLHDIV
ncbi:hypothetical protein MLD38_029315 [Melastoma candidum]|uniref:Uncharacterized protein n=1 Tax=Melastoma candidum TaxID=119954 RepID=A0ACB9N3C9_9MYRT|nr:hypothetical protein MLD38_029315 [Melastoma candidum]